MIKMDPAIFDKVREMLANFTGHSADEVFFDSQLEEDLGLDLQLDMPRLLPRINQEFSIELELEALMEELSEAGDTVSALAQLVSDECELG